MTPLKSTLTRTVAATALALAAHQASALNALQLDIQGGTYDTATQTIMAGSNSFSLYAYGLATGPQAVSLSDTFFLSMALVGPTAISPTPANLGSFSYTVGSTTTTVNVTADMTYGVPPLESILGGAGDDSGDLAPHGIFQTYFVEKSFSFSAADQSAEYNTQDDFGSGPQSGTGMYFKKFDLNIAGLSAGYGIHFDLYNENICGSDKAQCDGSGDLDVNKFAPFSHDAQGMTTPIPEPETYALLLAGLGLMGFVARRRKAAVAAAFVS